MLVLESRMLYTITVKGQTAFDTLFKALLASVIRIVLTYILSWCTASLKFVPILLFMTVLGIS